MDITYDVATIRNQYDTLMRWKQYSASEFAKMLKDSLANPMVVAEKSAIPQWKFCRVKSTERKTENMGRTRMLMLDYDSNNYSIRLFEQDFSKYAYALHTSYSYDGVKQKFRAFLFLDKEYDVNRLFMKCHTADVSPYQWFVERFPYADPASFVRAQFFKMPAVKDKDAPYYYSLHRGKPFVLGDNFDFRYRTAPLAEKSYLASRRALEVDNRTDRQQSHEKALEYARNEIEQAKQGERHNTVFSIAMWLKGKVGATAREFESIKPSWADAEYNQQVAKIVSEW